MSRRAFDLGAAILIACALSALPGKAQPRSAQETSAALFGQMATVLKSPRCMNCHTSTGFPRQGDDRHRHIMNVMRGAEDRGAPGLHCNACHQSQNEVASGVPGAPDWHLAPLRMGWEGLSTAELCLALMDPARAGMKPQQFVAHFSTGLVRWAWTPGANAHGVARSVPPIPHDHFVEITKRWVETGAECPKA
jgi:hypothetical protein